MKILKIFGVVVGIHVFALVLIFANPGCSSTTKPPPQPADTVAKAEPAPMITMPAASAVAGPTPAPAIDPMASAPTPVGFNPDAPASYSSGGAPGVRFTPTRPNTPAASAVQTAPVENVTPATAYVVKPGDSLWTLQKKFGVSVKDIAAANNLKTSAPIHEGQKLIIPAKSGAATTTPATTKAPAAATKAPAAATTRTDAPKAANGEMSYTVKPGDTIDAIAKKFDVRARDLAVHNNIDNPLRLRAGTVLSIPGWTSAGTAKASSGKSGASKSAADTTAKSTPPPAETKPVAPMIDLDQQPAQPASSSPSVPVIRIDDNPPAPSSTPKP